MKNKAGLTVLAVALAMLASPALAQPACKQLGNNRPNWSDSRNGAALAAIQLGLEGAKKAAQFSDVKAQVDAALSFCGGIVNGDRYNGVAQICLADSSALSARDTRNDTMFAQAVCAYSDVDVLASRSNLPARRVAALEAKAATLVEWSGLGGAMPGNLREALRSYQAADGIQPPTTPVQLWARAKVERALGQSTGDRLLLTAAESHLATLAAMDVSTTYTVDEKARALTDLARLKRDNLNRPPAEVRPTWLALLALRDTAEAHYEYGMSFVGAGGDAATAAAELRKATTAEPGVSSPSKQKASYQLAVMGARTAYDSAMATPNQWKAALDDARAAGTADDPSRRIACVAFIATGDNTDFQSLQDTDKSTACTSAAGPEGLLLKGLYSLRRAQFVPNVCKGASRVNCRVWTIDQARQQREMHLQIARDAFRDGGRMLGADDPAFDWLALKDGSAIKLIALLRAGEDITSDLRSRVPAVGDCGALPPGDEKVRTFFAKLDLLGCSPYGWPVQ